MKMFTAFKDLIAKSFKWDTSTARVNFGATHSYYPSFSSCWIHGNYVDCVRWYGDLVLSKSVDHRIVMWQQEDVPEHPWETCSKFIILMVGSIFRFTSSEFYPLSLHDGVWQEFSFSSADIWFIRFSLDFGLRLLACGNRTGKIYVWDMHDCPRQYPAKLTHKDCRSVVQVERRYCKCHDATMISSECSHQFANVLFLKIGSPDSYFERRIHYSCFL